jgi:bifunctional non-homologous end joining protein LigD
MRFPQWVVPMAATLTGERFSGPEWIFERKYDGIRLLAFRKGNRVRLLSRNQLPQTYPALAGAIGGLAVDQIILDGEVDWGDGNVNYHVFDILWLNGRDLMPLPLMERRAILHHLGLRPRLRPVPEIGGDKPWERACVEGWEGVIAKRRDSPYVGHSVFQTASKISSACRKVLIHLWTLLVSFVGLSEEGFSASVAHL